MYFYDILKEQRYRSERFYCDSIFSRIFEPIQVGRDLWISIQAGAKQASRPKSDTAAPKKITHWEVAIIDRDKTIQASEILPNFRSLAELELYYCGTYCFVPTDLVQELFTELTAQNLMIA